MAIQRILIVDDSPTERYYLTDILVRSGFTVSTAENAGSITLQVSRFGGTTGAVAVQFATSTGGANGSATAGSDFTTTSGTLGWASGEGGFKTITVPILQDSAAESAETSG